jgi:hypothetical protein
MNAYRIIGLMLMFLLTRSGISYAGDAALYGKSAPANAGFFRVINLDSTQRLSLVNDSGKTIVNLQPEHGSPYAFLPEGKYHFMLNNKPYDLDLHQGAQWSLAWYSDAVHAIADQPFKDKTKARVVLYNLTSQPLDLSTNDGKTVLSNVMTGQQNGRDVNAVKIPFSVLQSNKVLMTTAPISLQRGQVTSLFAIDQGTPALLVVEANR